MAPTDGPASVPGNTEKAHTLPTLQWIPTTAFSSRHGVVPKLITVHRWAGGTFDSVVKMFIDSPHDENGKSATFVYAGEVGPHAGRLAQMIRIADKPWTNAAWNPHTISIECADAIWMGHDPEGFIRLGRLIAGLCHYQDILPRWVVGATLINSPNGFTRHHDLGIAGGDHPLCPTTSVELWMKLVAQVHYEYDRGGFRLKEAWGLR